LGCFFLFFFFFFFLLWLSRVVWSWSLWYIQCHFFCSALPWLFTIFLLPNKL
jgi:hypothetical protein